jgi:peptidoglycan/LPS O-acetylase OafA/YrhL
MKGDRLHSLDALRGVAAVLVVLHHYGRSILHWPFVPEGWLAVDFFFILSGFVIDRAYRSRFTEGLSPIRFSRERLARLYPTMAIGIMLGTIIAAFSGMGSRELGERYIAQMLFIPVPGPGGQIYQLDGVQWSLTFELFANLVHVLILFRLSTRQLGFAAAAAFVAFMLAAHHSGTIAVGSFVHDFWGGAPRALFGYIVGVLLNRLHVEGRLPRLRVYTFAPAIALAVVILLAGVFQTMAIDLLAVFLFPLILIAALSTELRADGLGARLGALSYPLYAVHLPVMGFVWLLPMSAVDRFLIALPIAFIVAYCLPARHPKRSVSHADQFYDRSVDESI